MLDKYLRNIVVLADYIHLCSVSDPEIDRCMIESVKFLKPYLDRGIPELDIPAMEPLEMGNMHLSIGEGNNKVQTNATNLKVWGGKDFEILELKYVYAPKSAVLLCSMHALKCAFTQSSRSH